MTVDFDASQIRIVATDLDGTLLGADHRVSRRSMQVLAEVQAAGILVVAATGRGPLALPSFEPRGIVELAVCSNGAAVVDLATDEIIEQTDLAGDAAAAAMEDARAAIPGACFAWESPHGFGWEGTFSAFGRTLIDSYPHDKSDFDVDVSFTKLFVAAPDLGYLALAERVKDSLSIPAEVSSAGNPFVVITAANVTKATALARLCERNELQPQNVVAFGDSWNDLEMLQWAGLGVAMGNANDDVKAAADAMAGSHDDDGVAAFLVDLLDLMPS